MSTPTETATHTPGPWTFLCKSGPRSVTLLRVHYEIGVDGGRGVALVFGDDEANARLIAAAPDLYEALIGIIEIGRKDHSNEKYDGYYKTARAAIARVEGR